MFHVNQQPVHFSGANATTLLSVLRDELALSGPKFGCGQGECGACMVLVNGQPQTSCNVPVWAVQGQQVVTVEGLGTPEKPHPVQAAFIEQRAAQCGYCVAGIITAVVQALDKHLCRCGAQQRMIRAVQSAAAGTRYGASPGLHSSTTTEIKSIP
jgi:nicotinate dehydrogenase subunit A